MSLGSMLSEDDDQEVKGDLSEDELIPVTFLEIDVETEDGTETKLFIPDSECPSVFDDADVDRIEYRMQELSNQSGDYELHLLFKTNQGSFIRPYRLTSEQYLTFTMEDDIWICNPSDFVFLVDK